MNRHAYALAVAASVWLASPAAPRVSGPMSPRDPAPNAVTEIGPDGLALLRVNGASVRGRIGPGMPSSIYLARRVAQQVFGPEQARFEDARADRKALFVFHTYTKVKVGPETVRGKLKRASVEFAGRTFGAPVRWFEADAFPGQEALLGPWAIPAPIVRFHLRKAVAGETTTVLPLAGRSAWWVANTERDLGGTKIRFAFAPQFAQTVASAAAGAAIVGSQGGRFAGPQSRVVLQHGVERPARPAVLDEPLRFGALAIRRLLVRTSDYGNSDGIGEAAVDPSEATADVLVRGRSRSSKPSYVVYIGAEDLAACSSVTFDKAAGTIALACRG